MSVKIPEPDEAVKLLGTLVKQNEEIIQLLTALAGKSEPKPESTQQMEFRGSKRR